MVVTRKQARSFTVPNTEPVPPQEVHRVVHSPPPMPTDSTLAGPSWGGAHEVAHDIDDRGGARNIAQQEPGALPTSSSHQAHQRQGESDHSHTSSSATLAKKLAAQAEFQRRNVDRERAFVERERKIMLLEQKAEEVELQAKLAALEAQSGPGKSLRTCSSSHKAEERVATWVNNKNEPNVSYYRRPQASTHINQPVVSNFQSDPVSHLAKAIATLPERIKRTELVPFSGNINEWLAFKCTYERTKSLFTPADNIVRLIAAIRGAAKVAISSILWAAQDPEEIMIALEQNYARPELLVANEIAGLRHLKVGNAEHLNILANKLRNCVATMKLLNQHEYLSSIELLRTVLLKLSEHTRDRFTDFAATHKPFEPTVTRIELLSRFLLIEAQRQLSYNYLADVSPGSSSKAPFYKPFVAKEQTHATTSSDNIADQVHATTSYVKQAKCTYCKQGPHSVLTCKSFSLLSTDDRWRWIKESKTCYRCLKSNPHKWNDCRAKRCGFNGCDRRHHKLLHGGNDNVSLSLNLNNHAAMHHEGDADVSTTTDKTKITDSLNVANTSDVFIGTGLEAPTVCTRGLLKVLPVVLEGPRGTIDTFALLDEGSTATLIDGDIATRIGAETTGRQQLRVNGIGGMFLDTEVCYVNFHIRGRDSSERHLVQGARSITPLSLAPQSTSMLNITTYDHLKDISISLTYENATPTVLIGAADWFLSASREMRVGRKDEPVASRTVLGWVLHGAMCSSSKPVDFILHVSEAYEHESRTVDNLERLMKKQYEIDSLGIRYNVPRQNNDDSKALILIESTARRLNSGRFEVGLPWKENVSFNVPDSYPQALSRLKSIEKQMAKDESFASAYKSFIDGIIQKGYAEECDPSSYHKIHQKEQNHPNLSSSSNNAPCSLTWYLPHFGVYHPQKRKLRVVHDAAAVTRGVSLNSMLLQGPDLLQSLLDILFRFREGPIAFSADIKEMFPQIKIREQDRDALRFLWHDTSDNRVKEYRMSSVIFGAVSSPFIALYIKNKNAKEFEQQYPAATHSIIHDHYMDDFIGSEFKLFDATRLASDIVTVHKACGFEMRSWVSNVPEALDMVPKELHADVDAVVHLPQNNDVGALGVKWNPFDDTLGFRTGQKDIGITLTKRGLLSSVMSVYDPLGLLTPIVIQGRILMQKLWREGCDWDSPISSKYVAECRDWFNKLAAAASLRIPRCYESRPGYCDIQLHVIADGGEQAYACVAYWRYTFVDGSVSLALIGSKARVAPLKPLSIPRLELQAALIATRFAQTILKAHRTQPSAVHYWTDSTTVLKWIRSDARNFKAFVAHRLGEILESTNPCNWRWIPSELNIADDATKPKHFTFSSSHRWFAGPSFLLNSPPEWPCEPECNIINEVSRSSELKPEFVGLLVDIPLLIPPVLVTGYDY